MIYRTFYCKIRQATDNEIDLFALYPQVYRNHLSVNQVKSNRPLKYQFHRHAAADCFSNRRYTEAFTQILQCE